MRAEQDPTVDGVELVRDTHGLALVGAGMELRVDFAELLPRVRHDRLGHELLIRAARVKGVEHPVALDATAGLGEDSFLLAAAGFEVELYERDARVAAFLRDGLERAADEPELAGITCRMHLHEGDSIALLEQLEAGVGSGRSSDAEVGLAAGAGSGPSAGAERAGVSGLAPGTVSQGPDAEVGSGATPQAADGLPAKAAVPARPDVIYLDPMFPARRKSAAVKKKAQLIQQLETPCTDEEAYALVCSALAARPRKVVVKRPLKGPYLADVKPAYSLEGRSVRFDVLMP